MKEAQWQVKPSSMKVESQTQTPSCSVEFAEQGVVVRMYMAEVLVVIVRLLSGENANPLISSAVFRVKF